MLVAVPAALVMAAAVLGAGSRLRFWLRVPVQPGLRLPVDWCLGSLFVGVAVLLLGLPRLWSALTLGAVVGGGIAAGRWRRSGYRWSMAVAGAVGGLVAAPVALTAPFFYDALVYHLGLPWQALVEFGLRSHPEDLFSSFPPLAQLLYAPLLALGFEHAPALLHWVSFVAAGCAVGALARALGAPRWAATLAAGTLLLLPSHVLVPGLPAAEGWAVAGVLCALTVALAPRLTAGGPALAGVLAGMATAARLQGLLWSVMVLAVVGLRAPRRWRSLGLATLGWLAGSSPWWAKNLVLLHQPWAPLGWRREGVETLWRDAGSLMYRNPHLGDSARALAASLLPHLAYAAPLALAAVLALAEHPRHRRWLSGLVVLGGGVAWGLTGSLPRFLAATFGVLLALAAAAARTTWGRWATVLSLAVTAGLGTVLSVGELARWGGPNIARAPAARVRSALVVNNPFPGFAAAKVLPANARVLFVGEPRGFGFPRRFVAPSQHDVSPLRAILESAGGPGEAAALLRHQGFTHLLVNFGELARLAPTYPVAPWRDPGGWRRWNTFVSWLGSPVVHAGPVEIFVLAAGNPPAV